MYALERAACSIINFKFQNPLTFKDLRVEDINTLTQIMKKIIEEESLRKFFRLDLKTDKKFIVKLDKEEYEKKFKPQLINCIIKVFFSTLSLSQQAAIEAFLSKNTNDPLYGQGLEISKQFATRKINPLPASEKFLEVFFCAASKSFGDEYQLSPKNVAMGMKKGNLSYAEIAVLTMLAFLRDPPPQKTSISGES